MHWLLTLRITWVTWRARAHSSCSASQESVHRTAHHYPKKISKFRIWSMVSTGCLLPSRMRRWSVASLVSDSLWPNDCSPPGFSVYKIVQAWIVELVGMPSFRESPQPGDSTLNYCISWIKGRFYTHWDTWEAHLIPSHHWKVKN